MPKPTPACGCKIRPTKSSKVSLISQGWCIATRSAWNLKKSGMKTGFLASISVLLCRATHLASCIYDIQMLRREAAVAHDLHLEPAKMMNNQSSPNFIQYIRYTTWRNCTALVLIASKCLQKVWLQATWKKHRGYHRIMPSMFQVKAGKSAARHVGM